MRTYTVEIVETLVKTIEIHAKDEGEAYDTIRNKYYDGEIVLDSDDYLDTQIVVKR